VITTREAIEGFDAACRLALLDARARDAFDNSERGFWNSFSAIWIVAPFWFWILLKQPEQRSQIAIELGQDYQPPDMGAFIVVESFYYLLGWIAFPVVMLIACRYLGVGNNYVRFIVARNWSNVVIWIVLVLPLSLLFSIGAFDYSAFQSLALLALVAQILYLWFVALATLEAGGGAAALVVGLDILLVISLTVLRDLVYAI